MIIFFLNKIEPDMQTEPQTENRKDENKNATSSRRYRCVRVGKMNERCVLRRKLHLTRHTTPPTPPLTPAATHAIVAHLTIAVKGLPGLTQINSLSLLLPNGLIDGLHYWPTFVFIIPRLFFFFVPINCFRIYYFT